MDRRLGTSLSRRARGNNPRTVAGWQRTYDESQRAAIEQAYLDGMRPVTLICRLGAAGELKHEGQQVAPFEIPVTSARHIGKRAQKRREGKLATELGDLQPKDAIEALRRRLLSLVDHELSRVEKEALKASAKARTPKDIEFIIKLTRATREAAALPGPDDTRLPRKPGQRLEDGSQPPEGTLRENELTRAIVSASGVRNGTDVYAR